MRKKFLMIKTWLNYLTVKLKTAKEVIEGEIDMFAKLFAINIVEGRYPFAKVPNVLKPKVKEQIALMVEDNELLDQLTKEATLETKEQKSVDTDTKSTSGE